MTQKRRHRRNCNELGHAHELTFSCYKRFRFLQAERTCRWSWPRRSKRHAPISLSSLWAYVFMPEHVHLIVCHESRSTTSRISERRSRVRSPGARRSHFCLLKPGVDSQDYSETWQQNRAVLLAVWRRLRSECRRASDADEDDRLHPHESPFDVGLWKAGRLVLVECGLVFEDG